ncbi:12982_t:CDS:2 [Ambispora leptoticha]|uniref:Aspartokinase n=1 Tax=Ambispora leptoticha TaxID=144679 RepID=A0A9N8VRM0_9GLOM|nr:12982_t:CDS:2 [Ambispora leptoticha]
MALQIEKESASSASFFDFNKEKHPFIVQKYGGTSVGKFLEPIANIVKSYLDTKRVVIVCSARSGETKSKGTTNRLLSAAEDVRDSTSKKHIDIVHEICKDHIDAAKGYIRDPEILADLEKELRHDCKKLQNFLEAAQIIGEISPKSKDNIVGVGEKLSCRIVTAVLKDKGIDAKFVNLDNIVEKEFNSNNLDQGFYDYLSNRLSREVINCGNSVPVLTGFFGTVPGSLLSNIGRGYTDLCAALVAVGLNAEELQIWKEVDGIFTADPRKVPQARLLPIITPEEAAELTYYGSEVIHPFTMKQAIRAKIPIRIKNVKNSQGHGTIIFPNIEIINGKKNNGDINNDNAIVTLPKNGHTTTSPIPRLLFENGYYYDMTRRQPTAVTIKDNIIILNIHSHSKVASYGFLANVFVTLDRYGIVVDLISTSEVHVSMALGVEVSERDLQNAIGELRKFGSVSMQKNQAILSLVGKQMKNMVGIAAKMFTTLSAASINIEMISQGASEINISCVIDEQDATKALNVIHQELLTTSPLINIGSGPWFY